MPTAASMSNPSQLALAIIPDCLAPFERVFFRYVEVLFLQLTWSVEAAFGGLQCSCPLRVLFSKEDQSVSSQRHDLFLSLPLLIFGRNIVCQIDIYARHVSQTDLRQFPLTLPS